MSKSTLKNKVILLVVLLFGFVFTAGSVSAAYHFADFWGTPPLHLYASTGVSPRGISPDQIKNIYNLPKTGGHGTIAIIAAYDDQTIDSDLNSFSKQFGLPLCGLKNPCLEKHKMSSAEKTDHDWSMETSLDVEWAHAIAPTAKILLVEAVTPSGSNFLKAIDYAASRTDVVAVSMSWGGVEFPEEIGLDSHFVVKNKAQFFASSGDNGAGVSWPASSPNVISVGGTSLALNSDGSLKSETAWSGSGGGVSLYEKEPSYQSAYKIPRASDMRAVPDVSYDADPKSGFPIYRDGVWYTVGGTSAGSPQWAAIAALGGVSSSKIYKDKSSASNLNYFRDIVSGKNGICIFFCSARARYDYVTGLGSPLTSKF